MHAEPSFSSIRDFSLLNYICFFASLFLTPNVCWVAAQARETIHTKKKSGLAGPSSFLSYAGVQLRREWIYNDTPLEQEQSA